MASDMGKAFQIFVAGLAVLCASAVQFSAFGSMGSIVDSDPKSARLAENGASKGYEKTVSGSVFSEVGLHRTW